MSRPYLSIFITLLTVSCCFGSFFNLGSTQKDCTTGVSGYCSDCDHTVLCSGDSIVSETACSDGMVCQEISTFSSCVDSLDVEACECPETGAAVLPDVYDDAKFIVCDSGSRHIEECAENEVFDNDLKHCEGLPTTTSEPQTTVVTRSPLCPNDTFDSVPVSCTQFQICYTDGTASEIKNCPSGYVFDDDRNTCDQYAPFSCYGDPDGYYADARNCSVYHLCISEEIFGTASVCPSGQLFDDIAGTCVPADESTCIAVIDCGICPDAETYIKIDCLNYYKCEASTEGDLPFVPVLNTCPDGTCYNESTTYCEFTTTDSTLTIF